MTTTEKRSNWTPAQRRRVAAAAALQNAPASAAQKRVDDEKDAQAEALQNAAIGAVVDILTPR